MVKRPRLFWWIVAGPLVVLASTVLWAFPYLAVNEPIGAKVLVVEGWLDTAGIRQAADLVRDSGYTRVYTTGTVRQFAYLLHSEEAIDVELHEPLAGKVELDIVGNAGSHFMLLADGDTLLNDTTTIKAKWFTAIIPQPVRHIRLVAGRDPSGQGRPQVFVRNLEVDHTNINLLQAASSFSLPDGSTWPAWPTYADLGRSELIDHGVPADRIQAVPTYGHPRSRSWGNAVAFAVQAREDGIQAFDLATSGVHARRSRKFFRLACGPEMDVGVIALNDPWCTRGNWWKSRRGRGTLLKELIGLPTTEGARAKQFNRAHRESHPR